MRSELERTSRASKSAKPAACSRSRSLRTLRAIAASSSRGSRSVMGPPVLRVLEAPHASDRAPEGKSAIEDMFRHLTFGELGQFFGRTGLDQSDAIGVASDRVSRRVQYDEVDGLG